MPIRLLTFAVALLLCAAPAQAQFVVATTNDCTGCGSLRDAIIAANGGAAPATIDLTAIAGTISLATPLPTITVPLTMTGPGAPVAISGGAQGTVVLSMTEDVTLAGVPIEDALTKSGPGTLILTNALTYPGETAILAGAIRTDADYILSPASNVTVSAGALLDLNNNAQEIAALSGDGSVGLGDAVLVTTFAAGTVTFSGTIAGTINSGFVKLGAGVLVFSGTNPMLGFVDVEQGTLRLTGTNAVAASSLMVVTDGSILDLAGTDQTVRTLTTGLAIIALGSGTLTVDVPDPFSPGFVGGTITGTGNLVKIGPGDLLLFEPSTYTGNTTINAGILELFGDNFLPATSTLTVNGGSLFLDGLQTFAAVSGTGGAIDLCSCGGLTVNQAVNTTFAGTIDGAAPVVKTGPGTLTLGGANTYSGGTTVGGGTLLVNNTLASTGLVTVPSAGTLGGGGSVGAVNITGGKLSPGTSPGILNTGNLSLTSASTLVIELNGATAGTQYDQVNVTGSVGLGSAALTLSVGFTPAVGQTFVVVNNDGVDPITGTFAGLASGATLSAGIYTFSISYTGGDGNDVTLTFIGVPGAPTVTGVIPGNQQITVTFTAPASNGGSAITGYTATCGGITASGTVPSIVVGGLVNGTPYTCTVLATNVAGNGPPSAPSASVTPFTVPGGPTVTSVTPGNQQITVTFTAPASNGGSAITGYTASCGGITASGTAPSIVVGGLVNGTPYTCTVLATNAAGNGPPSAPSASVTPFTIAGAPSITSVTPGNGQIVVAFTPPASGGSPITGYTANCGGITATGLGSPLTVAGLANGTPYTCTVLATNAGGNGPPSAPSASVTPFTVPGAPTIGAATPGNGQATIAFTPPASNGGFAITGYTLTCTPGPHTATGTASPLALAGLANGTTYTCSVSATNAAGTSVASGTVTVTPTQNTFSGPSATGTGTITASFTGGGPGCTFDTPAFIGAPPGSPPVPPTAVPGVTFPHGLFDFRTTGCTPGSTLAFTVTYPATLPPTTQYWKYGPTPGNATPHWYLLPAAIAGATASFSITDGGLGDDDLAANGTIADQGGPGVPGVVAPVQTPTLSQWAMLLMALLIAMSGMLAARRRVRP